MEKDRGKEGRFSGIAGLRGIACLFIVCFHFYCLFVDDQGLSYSSAAWLERSKYLFEYSKNAVELFFMMAGFLTAWHYRESLREMSFGTYFQKRYGKLFFASVAVNVWALLNCLIRRGIGLEGGLDPVSPLRFLLSVGMINTGWFTSTAQTHLPVNTTMWFVDVLLLCYLLYFFIRRLGKNDLVYLALSAAMVLLGIVCLDHSPRLPFLWGLNGRGYATFFLGVLLAEFQVRAEEKWRRRFSAVLGLFLAGFFIFHMAAGFERVFGDFGTMAYVRYFEFVAAPGMILAAVNLDPVSRLLSWKPFLWLGALSSAVYYVHNCVMEDWMIGNRLLGDPLSFLSLPVFLLVFLSTIPAAMLYRRVSERMRSVKKDGRDS